MEALGARSLSTANDHPGRKARTRDVWGGWEVGRFGSSKVPVMGPGTGGSGEEVALSERVPTEYTLASERPRCRMRQDGVYALRNVDDGWCGVTGIVEEEMVSREDFADECRAVPR